jgi:predicted transcriptional regulator
MLDRASREEAEGSHLDISAFIETSAISIRDTISVQFTFRLFRRMELRQLAVVDSLHRVVGIITRSNLAVPSTGRAP